MKYSLLLFVACFWALSSCKKTESAPEISLNDLKLSGNSVELNWTIRNAGNKKDFVGVSIERKTEVEPGYTHVRGVSGNTANEELPVAQQVSYRMKLTVGSYTTYSEVREVIRPEIKLVNVRLLDVLYDRDNNKLFLFDASGKIVKYDVPTGNTTTQTTGALWFPDLAIHNGQQELYVPQQDGKVVIYNSDLQKIAEINVGSPVMSVAYSNGYLYTTSRQGSSMSEYLLRVYDRNTGELVSNMNNSTAYDCAVIKRAGNTGTELIGINFSNSFYQVTYDEVALFNFKYTAAGNFVSVKRTEPSNTANSMNFVVSADGSKFITAIGGNVYTNNHEHLARIEGCTGFGLDNNRLYAGRTNKTLEVFYVPDFASIEKINTHGYPFRVFSDGVNIISVNTMYYNAGEHCLVQIL
ncbi:MAG TPA: hypothetical protein VEB40_06250 [Flavipsychrobacter sp.]|nr:hypothetical protein [Flavipsychrobacter sp.]